MKMDEVQSWWEVPAIAHFCHAFRTAFKIFYFEIAELEAAILNIQDPEMSISTEQLIAKLLEGCFHKNEVSPGNWEEKLHEFFSENCDEGENPLGDVPFPNLSPRSKVEVLFKLCQFRLDMEGVLNEIKDIPSQNMQADCVGKDNENNVYWYFCDERLYKEDPSNSNAKKTVTLKANANKPAVKNGKQLPCRETKLKAKEGKQSWSIVCQTLSDWETLCRKFLNSKFKVERELRTRIQNDFIPKIKEAVAEKDIELRRRLRQRMVELGPSRGSSRISKLQAQKKMEEQMNREKVALKEAREKEEEQERRKQQAKERLKLIQEAESRSIRVSKRLFVRDCLHDAIPSDMNVHRRSLRTRRMSQHSESETEEPSQTTSRRSKRISSLQEEGSDTNRRQLRTIKTYSQKESESSLDESVSDDSSNENKSEEDKKDNSGDSSDVDIENDSSAKSSSDSECDDAVEGNQTLSHSLSTRSHNGHQTRSSLRSSSNVNTSYNQLKCSDETESNGKRTRSLRSSNGDVLDKKRLKPNENIGYSKTEEIQTDHKATYYKVNDNWYLNSCSNVAAAQSSIIRIDYFKPPAKYQLASPFSKTSCLKEGSPKCA